MLFVKLYMRRFQCIVVLYCLFSLNTSLVSFELSSLELGHLATVLNSQDPDENTYPLQPQNLYSKLEIGYANMHICQQHLCQARF
jgi:hypothetical protein